MGSLKLDFHQGNVVNYTGGIILGLQEPRLCADYRVANQVTQLKETKLDLIWLVVLALLMFQLS
jgi:hypothetical protein